MSGKPFIEIRREPFSDYIEIIDQEERSFSIDATEGNVPLFFKRRGIRLSEHDLEMFIDQVWNFGLAIYHPPKTEEGYGSIEIL